MRRFVVGSSSIRRRFVVECALLDVSRFFVRDPYRRMCCRGTRASDEEEETKSVKENKVNDS